MYPIEYALYMYVYSCILVDESEEEEDTDVKIRTCPQAGIHMAFLD